MDLNVILDKGKKAISKRTILINQNFHEKCEYTPVEKYLLKRRADNNNKVMADAKRNFLYI